MQEYRSVLWWYKLSDNNQIKPQSEATPTEAAPTEAAPIIQAVTAEMRQAERRRNQLRREGVRGLWEERRLFDRRERKYSIFGKRFDGSDDDETDISKVPDVEDEQLISPEEIEIFRLQIEENAAKNADEELEKRRRKL